MKPEQKDQRKADRERGTGGFLCSLLSSSHRRRGEEGSAIVFVMLTVGVLSVVAASLLLTNVTRYQTTFQSASWQEAIVGAEAGVDLAINELRKRVVTGPRASFQDPWTITNPLTGKTYANYGHAFSDTKGQPFQLTSHGGEGNTATLVRVFVDVPGCDAGTNFAQPNDNSFISQIDNPNLRDPDGVDRSRWLFRVKSLGITGVSGPPRPNMNKYDNRLRHFSFFNDWRTGRSVTSPQTARLVEAIVRPQTGFRNALMADTRIDLSNQDVLIDSYDSSKGVYSTTNSGNQGNIATNGQLINANKATVNGNAMTNNGTVNGGQNVTGQQSSSFYQELPPITTDSLNPAWSGVSSEGTVTSSRTYIANADPNSPTLVRMDSINLASGGNTVTLNGPSGAAANTPSYIKLYVQGDISTTDDSYINVATGVNAIVYFTGNVNLQGLGIFNNSMLASHLVLNGLQPTANKDGSYPPRSIAIATTQDFEGIVYAPNYDVDLALQAATVGTANSNNQEASKQLNKLLDDQNKAKDDWNKALAKYQSDMAAAGQIAPTPTLVVSPNASDLSWLPAPNGQTRSDVAKLQDALNKVAQTQVQIMSLQGTLVSSQADDHARGYNGIYGGFVARTFKVENKTHLHYDETLRTAGPVNHYEVVNWFEDDLSRDSVGGPETFWW